MCALLFLALLEVARLVFFGQFLGIGDFAATVGDKNDLRTGFFSWADTFGRCSSAPSIISSLRLIIGPVLRAWIAGQSHRSSPMPATDRAVHSFLTAALLAAIYLRGLYLGLRGKPLLMPLAFVLGALAWNGFFNINEPEHWFHLTVPTVALFLFVFPGRFGAAVLPLWAAATLSLNLALWALPEARYPLKQYQSELRQEFTGKDLLLYFTTYGGGPNLSFFKLATPSLAIDDLYEQKPDDSRLLCRDRGADRCRLRARRPRGGVPGARSRELERALDDPHPRRHEQGQAHGILRRPLPRRADGRDRGNEGLAVAAESP